MIRPIASRRTGLPAPTLSELILLLLIIGLFAALPRPATASASDDAASRVPDAESGRLFFHDAQGYTPAPLLQTDVRVAASGMVARTVVTQRFRNPRAGWVEGIYVFPLPSESAVDALTRPAGTPVERTEVPVNPPAGWRYNAVFGEQAAVSSPAPIRHMLASATVVAQSDAVPVSLPQTATAAEIRLILGALSLLVAVILLVQQFRSGRRT